MKKSMCIAVLGATLAAGLMSGTATAKSINNREHREQARIRAGIRSGELTRPEARRLEAAKAKSRVDERFLRQYALTAKERARLQKELSRASRQIYRQKHDNQDRN